MKKFLLGVFASIVCLLIGILMGLQLVGPTSETTYRTIGANSGGFNTAATTSVYSVGPLPVLIAATSTARVWTRIISTSTSMFLSYGKSGTVATGEIMSSPTTIDLEHAYTGAVWATAAVTGTVSVTDFSSP